MGWALPRLRSFSAFWTQVGRWSRLSRRSSNPLETKGLVVGDGGLLEVFGVRYAPTWTRLSAQAQAGSSTLQLMDEARRVGFRFGRRVFGRFFAVARVVGSG